VKKRGQKPTLNGAFDLLMSDMMLPGMLGDQLTDRLREINPTLPVLLFSGYSDQQTRWKSLATTDYAFANKPFTSDDLLKRVRQMI